MWGRVEKRREVIDKYKRRFAETLEEVTNDSKSIFMTMGASWSRKNRKELAPKPSRYDIETITVPPWVKIEGDFVGQLNNWKYANNDVRDIAKCPYFSKDKYMDTKPQPWGIVLY